MPSFKSVRNGQFSLQQYCVSCRSVKSLLKLSGLVKIFQQLSSTHVISPLLDIFVPQLISTGVKNAPAEEQSDSVTIPPLKIAQELLMDIEIEKDSVISFGRSE